MIRAVAYSPAAGAREFEIGELKDLLAKGEFIWLDIQDPEDRDFDLLADAFKFHPLAIEDSRSKFHLPKINEYEDHIFLIWHAIKDVPETPRLETAEVDVFLGRNYLVSIHPMEISHLNKAHEECLKTPDLMKLGLDYLLHSVLDRIVDDYFLIVDRISNRIDGLEDLIFKNPDERHIKALFELKHQMLFIRKLVAPERDIINTLSRFDSEVVKGQMRIYFQDIYDHLIRVVDLVDTSRDVISGAMDIYLSTVSNRLNEVMKKLTIVATIFMPLTLISGIYGMNFRHMPELSIRYYYFGVLAFMFFFAIGMFSYFRWRKWW